MDSNEGLYYYGARWYDHYLNRFLSPDSIVPNQNNPLDWDRYSYSSNNPINFSDPTGHSSIACQAGSDIPNCVNNNPPQSPSAPSFPTQPAQPSNNDNPWQLVNSNPYYLVYFPWLLFPHNDPCLGKLGCWGGIKYAHEMVERNGPTFNKISTVVENVSGFSGKVLDFYENWSGRDFNPKLGFGLDFAEQLGKDAHNTNLTLLQRGSRASLVAAEGIAVSAASAAAGNGLGDLALAASFEPAADSGSLWLPPAAYWAGFTVGYGVTNVTLSAAVDVFNDNLAFPVLNNLP